MDGDSSLLQVSTTQLEVFKPIWFKVDVNRYLNKMMDYFIHNDNFQVILKAG